jgi:hypothetical protein
MKLILSKKQLFEILCLKIDCSQSLYQINQQAQERQFKKIIRLTNIVLLGWGHHRGRDFVLTGTAAALPCRTGNFDFVYHLRIWLFIGGYVMPNLLRCFPFREAPTHTVMLLWANLWHDHRVDLILEYLFGSATVAVGGRDT